MEDALRLIVARSANATNDALMCLHAVRAKSPVLQLRYNHTVMLALADPAAKWSQEERELLSSYLDSGTESDARSYTLRVRLSPTEREHLLHRVLAAGQDMSEYVRGLILADD